MARYPISVSATEVITDSRESPLLLRNVRDGIRRPPSRYETNPRDVNVRYRFLKWVVLSISSAFLVNMLLVAS